MEKAEEASGYKKGKVWATAVHAVLGIFIFTYNIGVFTPSQPCVAASLKWGENSKTYIGVVSSFLPLGALIGALFAGYMSKHIGHRKNLIIGDLIIIAASLITILPSTVCFGLGRFLSGVGIGIFSALCPIYLSEISPASISGRIGSLISVFGCLGTLFAFSFALFLPTEYFDTDPKNDYWIFMFLFQGIVAAIQLSLFLVSFKNESPLWLLSKGQTEEALTSLKSLYSNEYALEILETIQSTPMLTKNDSYRSISHEFTYKDLITFTPETAKAMRLGLLLSIIQQFSGINAILSYATSLFSQFGSGVFAARIFTVFTGVFKFVSCFCLIPLIDYAGRKNLLIGGCIGMAICLTTVGLMSLYKVYYVLPIIFVELYLGFFVNSIGPICWLYSGEILCSKAMSICTAVNWFSAFLVVLCFPFMIEFIGLGNTFWIFAAVNIIGAVYFMVDMVETKGMTKSEIRALFIASE